MKLLLRSRTLRTYLVEIVSKWFKMELNYIVSKKVEDTIRKGQFMFSNGQRLQLSAPTTVIVGPVEDQPYSCHLFEKRKVTLIQWIILV